MGELSRTSEFCPLVPFLFILMQYCNGGSLDELIWHDGEPARPKPAIPISQIWQLLLDILLGLQHLHQQGILHRDLKPTNILLQRPDEFGSSGVANSGQPRALLSDFGTAAPFGEPESRTTARGYTGTVEYTAPELLVGSNNARQYTEKSDMWSLGIVLYAMCFYTLPFYHDDPHVLKKMICRSVEERRSGQPLAAQGAPLLGEDESVEATSSWLPPDPGGTRKGGRADRLGPLRLVLSALMAVDADRRPSATDLLENPAFRGSAVRYVR